MGKTGYRICPGAPARQPKPQEVIAMMETYTVRNATHNDLDAMVGLLHELFSIEVDFRFDPEKQKRGLQLMLDGCGKHRAVKVAELGGGIVGMCTVQTLISTAEGRVAGIVEDLVVADGFRGRGIGSALLASIEDWAWQRGIRRLQLLADRTNAPALSFYTIRHWSLTRLICLRKQNPDGNTFPV